MWAISHCHSFALALRDMVLKLQISRPVGRMAYLRLSSPRWIIFAGQRTEASFLTFDSRSASVTDV
jgi:hypothetical protein